MGHEVAKLLEKPCLSCHEDHPLWAPSLNTIDESLLLENDIVATLRASLSGAS